MSEIGSFGLLALVVISGFGFIAGLLGCREETSRFAAVAVRSIHCCLGLYLIASSSLLFVLFRSDFRLSYVASHSNRDLPAIFKLTAFWAGQEGSLLLWSLLLAAFASMLIASSRARFPEMAPHMATTLLGAIFFFSILLAFVSRPFNELAVVLADGSIEAFVPEDGQGLNPLLQHWAMVIHPPLLFVGYVACIVPFSICLAALITRRGSRDWLQAARGWALVAWFFLGAGILLGARWAYVELGWGGYWAWDPVENASLMPWLTLTAFLHSWEAEARRGMLKTWTFSLAALSFALSIFGTFLTRSGIVSSVHAFAASSIGMYFAAFLVVIVVVSLAAVLLRRDQLRSERRMDALVSKESGFFFANLALCGACPLLRPSNG